MSQTDISQIELISVPLHFAAKHYITLNAFIFPLFVQLENLGIILDSLFLSVQFPIDHEVYLILPSSHICSVTSLFL